MLLKIRVRNPLWEKRDRYAQGVQSEFHDHVGEIYPTPKWIKDDVICLTDPSGKMPFRTIEKENVICGWRLPNKTQADTKRVSIMVPGKKSTHIVTSDGINHSCDCIGFSYRKTCSHITEVTNELIAA